MQQSAETGGARLSGTLWLLRGHRLHGRAAATRADGGSDPFLHGAPSRYGAAGAGLLAARASHAAPLRGRPAAAIDPAGAAGTQPATGRLLFQHHRTGGLALGCSRAEYADAHTQAA